MGNYGKPRKYSDKEEREKHSRKGKPWENARENVVVVWSEMNLL